jgi:putative transposase
VFTLSLRRAAGLMMLNRSTMYYRSRGDAQHALRACIRQLAARRVRFSYRRLTVLLRRTRGPMVQASRPNEKWSMDLVAARLLDGRWFRVLAVAAQCTRECLLLLANSSLSGHQAAAALSLVVAERGAPDSITADNGTEFCSRARGGLTNLAYN